MGSKIKTRPNCKLYSRSGITVLKFTLDQYYSVYTQKKARADKGPKKSLYLLIWRSTAV